MAKRKFKIEKGPKKASTRPDSVKEKTVISSSGTRKTVVSVNANSASFSEDFLYAFARNVRAARRENRKILGSQPGAEKGR